jgi:hypothetical protein
MKFSSYNTFGMRLLIGIPHGVILKIKYAMFVYKRKKGLHMSDFLAPVTCMPRPFNSLNYLPLRLHCLVHADMYIYYVFLPSFNAPTGTFVPLTAAWAISKYLINPLLQYTSPA